MAQLTEENLLEAIQKDDIRAFNALTAARCGNYRLGRFPVLSLLYLYNSKKILASCEQDFLKISKWEQKGEPVAVAKKFADRAGKCLRLYLSEVVTPLEMLLILDETKRLKRVYPLAKPAEEIKNRLKSIYSVKYSLGIGYDGDNIIIDRRPLNRGEKKKIITACVSVFVAAAIAVAAPVTAVSLLSGKDKGISLKINLSDRTTYTLTEDLVIPENYSVKNTNCTIKGNGHKLVLGKGATLGELSGTITDAVIQTSGDPLFTVIDERAELSNVTVNVDADIQTKESSAFIALTNYGTLDGVTVNISGKVSALGGNGTSELIFGGMVLDNNFNLSTMGIYTFGTIKNCTVNYSDLTLEGEASANGVFAGIAGINRGNILDSTVTGSVTSDTFDLVGVCDYNGNKISRVVNGAALTQTTESDSWNPVVCGIVIENTSVTEYCENRGALSAKLNGGQEKTTLTVSVAGIARYSSRDIAYCKNYGSVTAEGDGNIYAGGIVVNTAYDMGGCLNSGAISAKGSGKAVVGGIAAIAYAGIYYCISNGDVTVNADTVHAGGIYGESLMAGDSTFNVTFGVASYCISESKINVTASGENSAVGGIAGFVMQGTVTDGMNEDGSSIVAGYFGGGVSNSFFTGRLEGEKAYFGSIAGVSGENIYYEKQLYFNDYFSFQNNYFVASAFRACGATFIYNDDGVEEYSKVMENMGATVSTEDKMKETDAYKAIMERQSN